MKRKQLVLQTLLIILLISSMYITRVKAQPTHDVAITNLYAASPVVRQGNPLDVNVTVANQGDFSETFDANAYYKNDTYIALIGTQSVTLAVSESKDVQISWDTIGIYGGTYTLYANITLVDDSLGNNEMEDGDVVVLEHDIAITEVTATPTTVKPGADITFTLRLLNNGSRSETFFVELWYGQGGTDFLIENRTGLNLASGANTNQTFVWTTTGVSNGEYYTYSKTSIPIDNAPDNNRKDGPTLTLTSARIYVDPPTNKWNPGQQFTINIAIGDVVGVNAWEVKLGYDSSLLSTNPDNVKEGPFLKQGGTTSFLKSLAPGLIQMGAALFSPVGVDCSGILANITFTVIGTGNTTLNLYDTTLRDVALNSIPHTVEDGVFLTEYPKAVFTVSPASALIVNRGVKINELVTFNATSSYDPDGTILTYTWDFGDNTNLTKTNPIAVHQYSLNDSYTATLTVYDNDGLTDYADKKVRVHVHDIAVISIACNTTLAKPGDIIAINVTIFNAGDAAETFNVTAFHDTNLIPYKLKPSYFPANFTRDMAPNTKISVIYAWNTSGVAPGIYTIWSNASLVDDPPKKFRSGEFNIADNTLVNGEITLSPGVPIAKFSYTPTKPEVKKAVVFNSTDSFDTDGWIVEFIWNFGDGNVTTVSNTTKLVTHTYALNKTYSVILTVTDNEGKNGTAIKPVKVALHDIAIQQGSLSKTTVKVGESVSVFVTVVNRGGFTETFNVNAYHNGSLIGTQSITLAGGVDVTVTFSWNTSGLTLGWYTITANVTLVLDEAFPADNQETIGQAFVTSHDIAIVAITVSSSTVRIGETLTVNVTIANNGGFTEAFNVTLYQGTTVISTQRNVVLQAQKNVTLTFTWSTTGIAVGSYNLNAKATPVPEETNTADNSKDFGAVGVVKFNSVISITVSPLTVTLGQNITITGVINPSRNGVNVVIQYKTSGTQDWVDLITAKTDENSQYVYAWQPSNTGTYDIRATWGGDAITNAEDSDVETVSVEAAPTNMFLYLSVVEAVVIVAIVVFVFLRLRKPKTA